MMKALEHTASFICSFNMISAMYYDVNWQLKVDGLVAKMSNMTRLLVKILKFLLIFVLSNFSIHYEFYDVAL